jgi:HSP20 family protein
MTGQKDNIIPQQSVDRQSPRFHVLMGSQQYLVVKHSHIWRPPTDVMEEGDRLVILVEIAGMRRGEFHVALNSQRLMISGNRPRPVESSTAYHQLEVRYGEFRTEVTLPWPVDDDGIVAEYDDGFLRIELPRASVEDLRVITVKKEDEA